MRRRDVLRLLAVGGAVGVSYQAVKLVDGVFSLGGGGKLISRTMTGMGTYVSVSVVDHSADKAEAAIARAFGLMDAKERLLTRFNGSSAVVELNQTGKLAAPPADLVAVLRRSGKAFEATKCAFDPTVAPLLELYAGYDFSKGEKPAVAEVQDRMDLVGFERVRVSEAEISLPRQGMGITLDGIAKGWIVDAMAESLRRDGIRHALVNAGGDIRAFGGRDKGLPWKIAVRDPKTQTEMADTFELTDGACATSGNYEVYFDKDKLYHHVINPRTGSSPWQFSSATVVAETATDADALSTSLLVLGKNGAGLVRQSARAVLLLSDKGERLGA